MASEVAQEEIGVLNEAQRQRVAGKIDENVFPAARRLAEAPFRPSLDRRKVF